MRQLLAAAVLALTSACPQACSDDSVLPQRLTLNILDGSGARVSAFTVTVTPTDEKLPVARAICPEATTCGDGSATLTVFGDEFQVEAEAGALKSTQVVTPVYESLQVKGCEAAGAGSVDIVVQ